MNFLGKRSLRAGLLSGLFAGLFAQPAFAETTGFLGLYKANEPVAATVNKELAGNLGCTVRREGMIAAKQGNMRIDVPNRFVLMACEAPLLRDPKTPEVLAGLVESSVLQAAFEGNLTDLDTSNVEENVSQRQYILKLGNYNNQDPTARAVELAAIGKRVENLPDRYTTEASVEVHRAYGMRTPDEVVVLSYETAASGDRFRDSNQSVLEAVGAFNKKHLESFVYLVGKAS